ncbi:MAG: SDR family oxidoreductase [Chloroflexi bacterium]|nr:SDR family oxidoreductase [Chloroflexota bacterium]
MDLELAGKVAIVGGASKGLGRACAEALAGEGASVAICSRSEADLERAGDEIQRSTGSQVLTFAGDLDRLQTIQDLVAATVTRFGRLDILINNSGGPPLARAATAGEDVWETAIQRSLLYFARMCREGIPHLKSQGGGRIINITTPLGKAPSAGSVPTSVSRAAGIALTKAMSYDLADDNILVNTVCIGHVKSAQMQRVPTEKGTSLEELFGVLERSVPLGRVGETQEAADLIAFLASERASYITGCAINLDGGFSAVV